ncbi:MAG: aminoglycoside phosphotransferase family protein [Candidatus Methylarchaceae archaeon HK02M1]|nr:aminoglycoside phosphotransferase family protein [Candidatus Methylarchaceae archaeon HK02M1]
MKLPRINFDTIQEYLSSVFKDKVFIRYIGELGKEKERKEKRLKAFGYGLPYLIEVEVGGERKGLVLETIKKGSFGHEHFSDRAQIVIWQHSSFNNLPKHVRSYDLGAFTKGGMLKSLGDCIEYFIVTEKVEGSLYHIDLDRIKDTEEVTELDLRRCLALSDYLVKIHAKKGKEHGLYVRRARELLGHGECIMGLIDSYPSNLNYIDEDGLKKIEKMCVEWRYILKKKAHRLSRVHGDFHPWNILFRKGKDFTVLDRSRGEWGEPADDLTSLSINYLFYSLQVQGKIGGHFGKLFMNFWENYIDKTKDHEIFEVVQPFFAWRGLVIASPIWYPNLSEDVRIKIFNFINNVLNVDRFDLKDVNSYLS